MDNIAIGDKLIDRFEVLRILEGGFGLVLLCFDHENKRAVALKTLKPEFFPDIVTREQFLREAQLWIELGKHPNIVRCYEIIYGEWQNVFLVLELVPSLPMMADASLRSFLVHHQPRPLSLEQILNFALQCVRGMMYAANKVPGLVHRDLKPENILIGRDGHVRITDFGLASFFFAASDSLKPLLNSKGLGHTQITLNNVVGTPLYMSPEQWDGIRADVRADIYAFGCVLFEMAVGFPAFSGRTIDELAYAHLTGRINEIPETTSSIIKKIINRCVALDRDSRPENWHKVLNLIHIAHRILLSKEAPSLVFDTTETSQERIARAWSFLTIGNAYGEIGQERTALTFFKQALDISEDGGDVNLEGATVSELGSHMMRFGKPREAIGFYGRAMALAKNENNLSAIQALLSSLGEAYFAVGNMQKAKEYHETALATAIKLMDDRAEMSSGSELGIVLVSLGDLKRAIQLFTRSLTIAERIKDFHGQSAALNNLGKAYQFAGDIEHSTAFLKKAYAIAKTNGNFRGESNALSNLALIYEQRGDFKQAIELYEQALPIQRKLRNLRNEATTLCGLGGLWGKLNQPNRAINYYEQAISIYKELGIEDQAAHAIGMSSLFYLGIGNNKKALELFHEELSLSEKLGDTSYLAMVYWKFALFYKENKASAEAIRYAQLASTQFELSNRYDGVEAAQEMIKSLSKKKRWFG